MRFPSHLSAVKRGVSLRCGTGRATERQYRRAAPPFLICIIRHQSRNVPALHRFNGIAKHQCTWRGGFDSRALPTLRP